MVGCVLSLFECLDRQMLVVRGKPYKVNLLFSIRHRLNCHYRFPNIDMPTSMDLAPKIYRCHKILWTLAPYFPGKSGTPFRPFCCTTSPHVFCIPNFWAAWRTTLWNKDGWNPLLSLWCQWLLHRWLCYIQAHREGGGSRGYFPGAPKLVSRKGAPWGF